MHQSTSTMEDIKNIPKAFKEFAVNSRRLLAKCTKPDRKEFMKTATATAVGFAIMGFIGFFVKLIHIPINNIIVGS